MNAPTEKRRLTLHVSGLMAFWLVVATAVGAQEAKPRADTVSATRGRRSATATLARGPWADFAKYYATKESPRARAGDSTAVPGKTGAADTSARSRASGEESGASAVREARDVAPTAPALASTQDSTGAMATDSGPRTPTATTPAPVASAGEGGVPAAAAPPVDGTSTSPVAAPPAAATPVAGGANAPPATTPAAPPANAPKLLEVGFGTVRLNGWIQAWYTDGDAAGDNTFRLRRAELRFVGQPNAKVTWALSFDAAKALAVNTSTTDVSGKKVVTDQSVNQASRMLQDAFVTLIPTRSLQIDIGQFKIPFTQEGAVLPWKIDAVEQPMYISDRSRGGGWANVRDIGMMVRGSATRRLEYFVGAFNSSGDAQNATDRNDQKSFVARLIVKSVVPGLQVGASTVQGGSPTADRPRRDRRGVEALFARRAFTLRGEAYRGADGSLNRGGYYVHAGQFVRPSVELIARHDVWDPDTDRENAAANITARESLVGANYFIAGHNAKVQLNVVRRTYASGVLPSVTTAMVGVQTAW